MVRPKPSHFERTVFGGRWAHEAESKPKHRTQLLFSLCQQILPNTDLKILNIIRSERRPPFLSSMNTEKNRENMGSVASLRMHECRIVFGSTK